MSTQVDPTLAKVSGTKIFTAQDSANCTITINIAGNISDLALGEKFELDYDFGFSHTIPSGVVSWSIMSEVQIPFVGSLPGPSDSGGPIAFANIGDSITGSQSMTSIQSIPTATFTAVFTASWSGIENGDQLTLTIPNNSIDFGLVPEPSSTLLLSVGGLLLFRRKRG